MRIAQLLLIGLRKSVSTVRSVFLDLSDNILTMKLAVYSDKEKVVKIITESFKNNPHLNCIVKNDQKKPQRLSKLAEYAFYVGWRRNGVFLTEDEKGVVIIYEQNKHNYNFKELFLQVQMVFQTFTLPRILKVAKLESTIKKNRCNGFEYLYLWFFGVADESLGSSNARELMKFVFSMSAEKQLPICIETSLCRNAKIYERFGFQSYRQLYEPERELRVWFMRRDFAVNSQ